MSARAKRHPDTIPPDVWRRLMRHLSTADTNWDALIERLESGDSGCIEFHISNGQARTMRLRDWLLNAA